MINNDNIIASIDSIRTGSISIRLNKVNDFKDNEEFVLSILAIGKFEKETTEL